MKPLTSVWTPPLLIPLLISSLPRPIALTRTSSLEMSAFRLKASNVSMMSRIHSSSSSQLSKMRHESRSSKKATSPRPSTPSSPTTRMPSYLLPALLSLTCLMIMS